MEGRFELKYVIDSKQRAKFLHRVQDSLIPDPHGVNAIYRVSSVYYDTHDFSAYWEKVDGEGVRRKYRLRYYSMDESTLEMSAAFMEVKHRIHNTVYKQRVRLTIDGAKTILDDDRKLIRLNEFLFPGVQPDLAAIADVERAAQAGLEGKATITYLREAWMGVVDDRLRLTFDSRGQSYSPSQYAAVNGNSGQAFMPSNQIIMEVKFNRAIPRWIRDALNDCGLVLQRFSKYAAGVETPVKEYVASMTQSGSEVGDTGDQCRLSAQVCNATIQNGSFFPVSTPHL